MRPSTLEPRLLPGLLFGTAALWLARAGARLGWARGERRGGRPHGRWTYRLPLVGPVAELTWVQGVREGPARLLRRSGAPRMELDYLAGRPHGTLRATFSDGRPAFEATYTAGVLDGPSTRWWRGGGKRCTGRLARGRRTGEWFFFTRDARLDAVRTGLYDGGLRFGGIRGFNDWR